MKTKLTSLVLTAALGLFAGLAANAAGDILDIRPCDANGVNLDTGVTDISHPLKSGTDLYFKVRLIAPQANGNRWYLKYSGYGSDIVADALYPMQIGIYVSGRLDYATLVSWNAPASLNFSSELIFKYTTKPGDFALPIVLAAKESEYATDTYPSTSDSSGVYALNPLRSFWNFAFDKTTDVGGGVVTTNTVGCSWRFKNPLEPPITESDVVSKWRNNTTLSECGFFVKTIDFSDDDEDTAYWRSVHENSTITGGGIAPRLVTDAPSTNAVTLYVWSENEDVFYVDTDNVVNMRVDTAGTIEAKHVGEVTFAGGQVTPADFAIRGAPSAEGRTAKIVLSAYPQYNFNSETNLRLTDFLTRNVKCIEPMPPSIIVESDRAEITANSAYTQYAAILQVYLSQAYSNDLYVTITPQFTDVQGEDWKDYFRFSTTSDTIDEPMADGSDAQLPVVRIPANSTDRQTIYVFALRSDAHTLGSNKVKFQSSIDDPEAMAIITEPNRGAKSLNVKAEVTSIIAPEEGSKAVSTTCNDEFPFTIAVSDTYADTHDATTGYQIYIKYRSSDTFVQLDGSYYVGDGGALYKLDLTTTPGTPIKTTEQPILKYTVSGLDLVSEVYVVPPVNQSKNLGRRESEHRKFLADVKEARTASLSYWDESYSEEKRTFNEGESMGIKIKLSEKYEDADRAMYAYLKPSSSATADMFASAPYNFILGMANPEGIPVENTDEIEGMVVFLDGLATPGLTISFEVVLSYDQFWDGTDEANKRIKGYASTKPTVKVYNIEPTVIDLEMNNLSAEQYAGGNNGHFSNKLPMGQTQRFKAVVDDPGEYDLTNLINPFQVRWTAMLSDGTIYDDPVILDGDPEANLFDYSFPAAGEWLVKAEVKDKDMKRWSAVTYTVYVTVLDQPVVEQTPEEEMSLIERLNYNDSDKRKFTVGVGYWDPRYNGELTVVIQVKSMTPAGKDPGLLEFDSGFRLSAAAAQTMLNTLADPEHPYDAESDYYVVTLNKTTLAQALAITAMDGTDYSSIYGFKIQSFVVNDDVLPTSRAAANAYYLTSKPTTIFINNLEPEIGANTTQENTNAWKVAGGAATQYPIKWQVKYDVERDWTELWADGTGPGIKITFSGCQNADAESKFITEAQSGTFVPNFGSAQGDQIVTMTIEDKDGGTVTFTYLYTVEPSKFLKTLSTGPSGGTTTSALSQRYYRMNARGGLGQGHTFVSGATFSTAEAFELAWNCGKQTYATAYAFGYKAGPTADDNTLNGGFDIGIDINGDQNGDRSLTNWYIYDPADGKDSFFYLWILTTLDENGAATDTVLGNTISPEVAGPPGKGRIPLPTAQTEDGAYLDTIAEAIFAKEWKVEDNLGDMNQDGVPDTFAVTVWGNNQSLIQATTGLENLDGDLNDLAADNPDEDYLPGTWDGDDLALVNKGLASYAPIGRALNNRLELRGFHVGLNETSIAASDVSFSKNEEAAYKIAFAAKYGRDWTDADGFDLAEWSPEPRGEGEQYRMDPTLDDTDSDGFPDGWEYFFWYQAKVMAPANDGWGKPKNGQKFVFERFNAANILVGTEISAAEVLGRFDPCVQLDTTVDGFNPDFDRDGLTDAEELLIGTNPCHWDTDGDHMCDGWEVMNSLDPLNGSKDGNPDGDFMAFLSLEDYFAVIDANDPNLYIFDLGGELEEGRDYEMTVVQVYADKATYDADGSILFTTSEQDANGDDNYIVYTTLSPDGVQTFTLDDTDADGNPNDPYMTMAAITIRDVPLTAALIAPAKLNYDGTPYTYGLPDDAPDPAKEPEVWHWGYPMLNHMSPNFRRGAYTIPTGTELIYTDHILIHDQVHAAFGFDPRTGWYKNGDGYVANRWNPSINTELSPLDSTGVAVNTDPYCNYDEYLVLSYRYDFGVMYPDDGNFDLNNMWGTFMNYSTAPSVVYALTDIESVLNPTNETGTAYDDFTAANLTATANIAEYLAQAFAQARSDKAVRIGHGADTDHDGVPDGWELYVGRNPNSAPNLNSLEGFAESGWDWEEMWLGTSDKLGYAAEYAGTDSCNAYKNCPSIYDNHPGLKSGWFNKFFPTNPNSLDTDGDGIIDGYEGLAWRGSWSNGGNAYLVGPAQPGLTFIYATQNADYGDLSGTITCCLRGGGMNPLTVDSDIDGLPDPWEMTYAGIVVNANTRRYAGPDPDFDPDIDDATFTADGLNDPTIALPANAFYICGGMDATWGGDGWTDPITGGNSTDSLLGTTRDVDFDHDGLQNYQEYLVQQVRHFRYDDITTPLMGHYMDEGPYSPGGALLDDHKINVSPAFVPMMQDPIDFTIAAIDAWADGSAYNLESWTNGWNTATNEFSGQVTMTPNVVTVTNIVDDGRSVAANKHYGNGYNYMYSTPWTEAGWRANGYMAMPLHGWDRMITCMLINPYIMLPPSGAGYVSTSPFVADTDSDGMDDYYEMFHGLNPLLGSTTAGAKDVIALAWGQEQFFNAFWNEWTHQDFSRVFALMGMPGSNTPALQAPAALDPILYPWAMGAGEADPDGDGLRNDSERVTANLTSPMTTHTDPTPLWFTDASSANSYVAQYYRNTFPVSGMPFWPILIGFDDPYSAQTPDGGYGGLDFLYPFEENEGFDTDNDWKGDGHEIVTTTRPASDPLDFSDPSRRQALYLNGDNSWVQSRSTFMRDIFMGVTPSSTTVDFFKQFTVEAWICPEKTGEQTILDRSSAYGYDAINKEASAIRSNFRIGLTADGRVYGMFDNDDAIESGRRESVSCQSVFGPQVPLNKWTHVAMTYDGNALLLYVNGIERGRAATHLIPANGVTAIMQDPTYTNSFISLSYEAVPGAFFIGGRPVAASAGGANAFGVDTVDYAFMNQNEWYQGYVDEVRIWDGARTASEISANYAKKLSKAEITENREEVYAHLMSANADASRNNNDGLLNLPAELVQLYDFSTLPGAVNAGDVAKTPGGFDVAVGGQLVSTAWTPGLSTDVGWWTACATKSTVYDDYSVVPWVENAVHHLPVMDGSVVDSFLYSDYLGGYATLATKHPGLDKYTLNNSSMPYAFHNYYLERYQRLFKLNLLMGANPEDALVEDLVYRYEYEIRSDFIGTADLVPMGGAYAKTAPELWDGNGAADAWEFTQVDSDADGLPDWWEALYGLDSASNYDWNTTVDWNGATIPAYIAYSIDLALGMQPDGQYHSEYASTVDADGDNIPDWWEKLFGVEEYGADDDADKDGLSNYAEYLISFGPYPYGITNNWPLVSPRNAFSTADDQKVPDYYLRTPQAFDANGRHISENEYFGEIFTDHDFMESWWESNYSKNYANPRIYDPDKDADGDDWSNWAEARTFVWRGAYSSDLIDSYYDANVDNHINDYPRPAIGLRVTYNGNGVQNVTGVGLVVRTTTGRNPRMDATFNLSDYKESSDVETIIGGYYGDATLRGFLSPGSLIPGDVSFMMCRLNAERTYTWTVPNDIAWWWLTDGIYASWDDGNLIHYSGTYDAYRYFVRTYGSSNVAIEKTQLEFEDFATTISDSTGWHGSIMLNAEGATAANPVIGTIDFRTGEYEIDITKVTNAGINLDGMVFKAIYTFRYADKWPKTFWLSEPTSGWVREGLNTIEAWIDMDQDGAYTPGEPYGIVRNVNVGWHKTTEAVIELKDTSSVIPRYALSDGSSDRSVVLGVSGGVEAAGGGGDAGGLTTKVVVRRVGLNGMRMIGLKTVPSRKLVAKSYVLDDRAYLTEADVLSDDKFDLDWKWLVSDAVKLGLAPSDLKSAEYEIDQVIEYANGSTTNVPLATFSNAFNKQRPVPVVRTPLADAPVYSAAPTFRWSCADDTMTAFRLQVSTSTNASDVIYDSGIRQLPGRDSIAVGVMAHAFTPPLYVDDVIATNGAPVFADVTNYYWRVTEFNAKYNTVDSKSWSAWAPFQMDVANENRYPRQPTGYGQCGAVVRYFGPGEAPEGQVVVEAHSSADFASQPLAQVRADITQLDDKDDVETVNATFKGIEPGTVYLMAYIDSNNNGKRDSNESWGYANYVGSFNAAIFAPRGVTVTDEIGRCPSLVVYIEDTDVNRNEIPDILESAAAASEDAAVGDSDRDGLADDEEDGFATDSSVWDTDGDGMPDGWEVKFADLDPNFDDGVEVADGDVMAFVTNACTIVTVQNTAPGSESVNYILKDDGRPPIVGDAIDGYELYTVYDYPLASDDGIIDCYGRGALVTNLEAAAGTTNRVVAISSGTVALVHAQVYDEFGFDPKTANPTAYADETAVNTKPFTALDKYLVIRYFAALGICSEDDVNVNGKWAQYSLKPFDADNDKDGAPDGWELYVMFGKNEMTPENFTNGTAVSAWKFDDRESDNDDDNLPLAREYDGAAPTDPWNAHTISSAFTDFDAWKYGLKTPEAQLSDGDNDGLSNVQEYRAFAYGIDLDIGSMRTDGETIDYFRQVDVDGKTHYIGEVVADHDFMEDYLEDESGYDRGLYDATKDADKDGWSNWAETRAYVMAGVEYIPDIVSNRVIRTNISVAEYDTIRNNYEVIEDTIDFNARYDDAGNLIGSSVTGSIIYWDTQTVMRAQSSYSETPYPTVKLTVAYDGEKDIDAGSIVIEAYSSAKMQKKLCWWTLTQEDFSSKFAHNGYVTLELKTPDHGYLKEGTTHFAVFADMDSNGTYNGAEPFGIAKDVQVGYNRATDFAVELKDVTPVVPRIDFVNLTCDRVTLMGTTTNTSNVVWGGTTDSVMGNAQQGGSFVDGEEVRVRVIRTAINGNEAVKKRTLVNRVFTVANRSYLHEGDFMTSLKNDLDPYLAVDAKAAGIAPAKVDNATYEVVLGDAKYKAGSTNVNEGVVASFVNTYPKSRATGMPLAPSVNSRGVLTTAQATFDFTADTSAYTAYVLEVSDNEGFASVLHSTTNLLTGAVKGTVSATPAWYFEDGKTYYWRVALLNGKYTTLDKLSESDVVWSDPAKFTVDLRGEATAEVKYFGPAETDGKIVVEAYLSPDFVGDPVARVQGGSLVDCTNSILVAGLPSGELYLLAFIDRNGDGVRQSYESWGYACKVGTAYTDLWTPVPVTVDADTIGDPVVAEIYIEDTDINQNFIVDPLDDEDDLKAAEEVIASESSDDSASDISDRDGDGLKGYEEEELGTDPDNVDSDGDGMWDGWEVWAGTDPLSPEDADDAIDGDVMAYVEIQMTVVRTRSTQTGAEGVYLLPDGVAKPTVGDNMNGKAMYIAYEYGKSDLFGIGVMTEVPTSAEYQLATVRNTTDGTESDFLFDADVPLEAGANVTDFTAYEVSGTDGDMYLLGPATNLVVDTSIVEPTSSNIVRTVESVQVSLGTNRVIEVISPAKVALVHNQVYQKYGYSPKTANGTLADSERIDTKPFTALDKYLLIRYFAAQGLCDEKAVNAECDWAAWSLKPGVIDGDWGDIDGRYGDGIADGWELYVGEYSPWNFDDREADDDGDGLPLYREYDGGHAPTDPWNADTDGDGITDDLAWKYHLKGRDGIADADGDGLSNYVEYLLAEVFAIAEFSPDDAFSVNPNVSDYFYRLNQLYAGEIFTDHDRVKDLWESGYFVKEDDVSPYVYDEMLDPDGDGWSNYAEFQVGTAPTKLGSLSVDAIQMDEYPVPTIELKISYNGNQSVGDKAVVVKAWSDPNIETIPDAVWTLGGEGDVSITENGNSNIVTGVKYFGMNPMREMLLHLSPGSVVPGSVKFEFKDLAWVLYNEVTETGYLNDPATALWEGGIIDQQRNDGSGLGDIVSQDETSKSLGTIDYTTGEMKVDFASFSDYFSIVGDIAGRVTGDGWYSIYNLQKSYVRVNWQSKLIAGSTVTTYYLSEADKRSASNNSLGHVKEGVNTFIAFYDLDGDGMYTAGEPYGCATGIDVGWNYARAEIELTDTHPISARVCCITGTTGGDGATSGTTSGGASNGDLGKSDRQVLWGTEHGDIPPERILISQETGGEYMRLRVVRTLIDGEDCRNFGVPDRVVLDKTLCVDSERYLTEVDFLRNGALDIDWENLAADLAAGIGTPIVSNVTYRIVMGEGEVSNSGTNNCVGAFNRWFDSQAVYNASKPILLNDDAVVTTVSPTFKWAIPSGLGTYTAFRLQIIGDGLVWDSGFQRMPSRIMDYGKDYKCHYEWTAPIAVNDVMANGHTVFANNTRYAWRVTVANARFRENWSVQGHFRMNVPEPSQECGTARVAVRYYGPSNVANGSVIRVEAFSTPDFSGEPVSRGYVTSKADIASADAITAANATLPGLKVGSYYIRAYIDTQSDGTHDDWESWGYYCTRDVTTGTIYTPRSVTVGPEFGISEIIPVYIDDCDTDQDCLPDAWEWAENGNLTTYGSAQIDQTATGGFALKTSLAQNLRSGGSPSGGLAVMVSRALSSPRIAAQIVGVDATGTDDQVNSALANASADAEAAPVAVAITAITLDRTAGTVSISADTEGAAVGSVASDIYTIPAGSDTLELTCKVMHRDSLDSGDWTVIKTEKVTIEKKSRTYTFNLGSSPIDLSSGFFKVSLEK